MNLRISSMFITHIRKTGIYESLLDKLIVPMGCMMDWQISH